jgi:tryptophan synthase beta subunit
LVTFAEIFVRFVYLKRLKVNHKGTQSLSHTLTHYILARSLA